MTQTAASDDVNVLERDVFEVIGTQRAMRRLKPDPVPEELIKKVIWAATRAPSGGNTQPWRFLVVTDGEKRRELQRIYSEGGSST
jgi:nitroreductase